MAASTDLVLKINDAILPEIKHEPHHTHFAILKPLLPAQHYFYFSPLTHDGNEALPEARGIRSYLSDRPFRFGRPTGINLTARELDQPTPRLFAHSLIGSQFIQCQQHIGCIYIALLR